MIYEDMISPFDEIVLWVKTAVHNLYPDPTILIDDLTVDFLPHIVGVDYSISTFKLSKILSQDPSHLAIRISGLCSKTNSPLVKKIYAEGPYINIKLDRKKYSERVLEYICNLGNTFGTHHKTPPEIVSVHYLDPNLRTLLVGSAIGRFYEWCGYVVNEYEFKIDSKNVVLTAQSVIADFLKNQVAEYIGETKAVVTLPLEGYPPLLLQKHDKSVTKNALYLAYQKNLVAKTQASNFIFISPKSQSNMTTSLIINSKRMGYMSAETKISTVLVDEGSPDEHLSLEHRAIQYAILRIPTNKKLTLDKKSLFIYPRLINLMHHSKERSDLEEDNSFALVQLLIAFPLIITKIQLSHRLEHLCFYLENILDLYEKELVAQNIRLSKATTIVLQNGLKILLS